MLKRLAHTAFRTSSNLSLLWTATLATSLLTTDTRDTRLPCLEAAEASTCLSSPIPIDRWRGRILNGLKGWPITDMTRHSPLDFIRYRNEIFDFKDAGSPVDLLDAWLLGRSMGSMPGTLPPQLCDGLLRARKSYIVKADWPGEARLRFDNPNITPDQLRILVQLHEIGHAVMGVRRHERPIDGNGDRREKTTAEINGQETDADVFMAYAFSALVPGQTAPLEEFLLSRAAGTTAGDFNHDTSKFLSQAIKDIRKNGPPAMPRDTLDMNAVADRALAFIAAHPEWRRTDAQFAAMAKAIDRFYEFSGKEEELGSYDLTSLLGRYRILKKNFGDFPKEDTGTVLYTLHLLGSMQWVLQNRDPGYTYTLEEIRDR